jgi:hypothetical protein
MPEYFTLPELRALPHVGDTDVYTDARCEAAAAWAVALIEREVGASFVVREHEETHDGGRSEIVLGRPHALNTPAPEATEDGVAVTDDLRVKSGVLRRFSAGSWTPITWASGVGNVAVTYSAGYSSAPPADVKEAALLLTRLHLLETDSHAATDARTTQRTNEMGGTTTYAVAGADRPTGYPAIDAVIVAWRNKLGVFGFA